MKTREMFSFNYWIKFFITKRIINHIKSNQYFCLTCMDFTLHYFYKYHLYHFEYSIKSLETFKCFNPVIFLFLVLLINS